MSQSGAFFDGTNDYLNRGSDLTSNTDSKVGTISFWVKRNSTGDEVIYRTQGLGVGINFSASLSDALFFQMLKPGGSVTILSMQSTVTITDTSWHHVLAAWDLAASTAYIYIDDSDVTQINVLTNDVIDYTVGDHSIGALLPGAGFKYSGDIAEFYFNTIEYVDITVAANRRKFDDGSGNPEFLGSDGSWPTGNQPIIYLRGLSADFPTNRGYGGGFTENGALTDAASPLTIPEKIDFQNGVISFSGESITLGIQQIIGFQLGEITFVGSLFGLASIIEPNAGAITFSGLPFRVDWVRPPSATTGREPIIVIEPHLDYCSRTYGRYDNSETGTDGCYAATIHAGTAAGGSSTTMTFPTLGGVIDLTGTYLRLLTNTGAGQERIVTDHTQGSPNDTVTVASWTAPDATTTFSFHDADGVLTADRMCFNTRPNCQDVTNYNPAEKIYRYCEPRANLPTDQDLIPCVQSVNLSPTMIDPVQGFGRRANVSCSLLDFTHHDIGLDKYRAKRTYDATGRGTYAGRWVSRNKYYQNRILRIRSGFITDPWDWNLFEDRDYVFDQVNGPDISGVWGFIAKDFLKLAEDKRALIPRPSNGTLASSLSSGETTSFDLSPSGIGSEYPAGGGRLRIGDELIDYASRSSDTVSTLTRGVGGTAADSHDAGDTVQKCYVLNDENVVDFVRTALTGADAETSESYAGISASYINNTDWNAERDTYLANYDLARTISEPTGISKIIGELIEIAPFYIWWDERQQLIRLRAVRPVTDLPSLPLIDDDSNIIKGSFSIKEDPRDRISEVWLHYLPINQLETENTKDYRRISIVSDTDASSAQQYGERRVKKLFAPWYDASNAAQVAEMGQRVLSMFRDNQRLITFEMDRKDATLWTGDVFRLSTSQIQNPDGSNREVPCRVLSVRERGDVYDYEVREELLFTSRVFRFGPDSLNDYNVESAGNKSAYGFWANDDGFMSDTSDGYATS